MNEKEIIQEFKIELTREFSNILSENLYYSLQANIGKATPHQLQISSHEYLALLARPYDAEKKLTLHEASVFLNTFWSLPFKNYEDQGYDLVGYTELVKEARELLDAWEKEVQPYRATMNRKIDILRKMPGLNKGGIISN